jgi:uncharacterized protein (DUF1499 family)
MGRALMSMEDLTEREKEACEFFKKLVSKIERVRGIIVTRAIRGQRRYLEIQTFSEVFNEVTNEEIYRAQDRLLDEFSDLSFNFSVTFLFGQPLEYYFDDEESILIYKSAE